MLIVIFIMIYQNEGFYSDNYLGRPRLVLIDPNHDLFRIFSDRN